MSQRTATMLKNEIRALTSSQPLRRSFISCFRGATTCQLDSGLSSREIFEGIAGHVFQ